MSELELLELPIAVQAMGPKRRDALRRAGPKALAFAGLARAGVELPRSWLLDAGHFEAFATACLPRRHDLRALVRAAGSRAGNERAARAFARLSDEPLPDTLREALAHLWRAHGASLPHGLCARLSVAHDGERVDAQPPGLEALAGAADEEALVANVRELWARSVTATAVAGYAAAGVREPGIALLLQQAVPAELVVYVVRHPRSERPRSPVPGDGPIDFRLTLAPPPGAARRVGVTLRVDAGIEARGIAPAVVQAAKQALGPAPSAWLDIERAAEIVRRAREVGARVEAELGRSARACLHVHRTEPGITTHLVSLHEGGYHRNLRTPVTPWVELGFAAAGSAPPSTLARSLCETLVERALHTTLEAFGERVEDDTALCTAAFGRAWLDVQSLGHAAKDVPFLTPATLAVAFGAARPLNAEPPMERRSLLRVPFVAVASVLRQMRLAEQVAELERAVERDFRGIQDLDLTLLPDDAMSTTLDAAETVLETSASLFARCSAAQLAHALALEAIVRRRIADAPPGLGHALVAGAGQLFGSSLALGLWRTAENVARDEVASARLLAEPGAALRELPDGLGRGAIGQLLAARGDLCLGAAELARPRWREDAREPLALLRAALGSGLRPSDPVNRARALADTALARVEPSLGLVERRLVWSLVASARKLGRLRVNVDQALYRALSLARRVVLDVDRRLRRVDGAIPRGGAFHCTLQELGAALKSGRPELAELVRMRAAEQLALAAVPPPPTFLGAPPRGPLGVERDAPLEGVGASQGVVEGRALVVPEGGVPDRVQGGEILVVASADVILSPLYLVAGGVVAASGGSSSPGAETLREFATPAVLGVRGALQRIRPGAVLRIDGQRGTVEELERGSGA